MYFLIIKITSNINKNIVVATNWKLLNLTSGIPYVISIINAGTNNSTKATLFITINTNKTANKNHQGIKYIHKVNIIKIASLASKFII